MYSRTGSYTNFLNRARFFEKKGFEFYALNKKMRHATIQEPESLDDLAEKRENATLLTVLEEVNDYFKEGGDSQRYGRRNRANFEPMLRALRPQNREKVTNLIKKLSENDYSADQRKRLIEDMKPKQQTKQRRRKPLLFVTKNSESRKRILTKLRNYEKQLVVVTKDLDKSFKSRQKSLDMIEKLIEEKEKLEKEIGKLTYQRGELIRVWTEAEQDVKNLEKEKEEIIKERNQTIDKLIDATEASIVASNKLVESNNRLIADLRQNLQDKQNELAQTKTALDKVEEELKVKRTELATKNEAEQRLETDKKNAEKATQTYAAEKKTLETTIAKLKAELKTCRDTKTQETSDDETSRKLNERNKMVDKLKKLLDIRNDVQENDDEVFLIKKKPVAASSSATQEQEDYMWGDIKEGFKKMNEFYDELLEGNIDYDDNEKIEQIKAEYDERVEGLKKDYERNELELQAQVENLTKKVKRYSKRLSKLRNQIKTMESKKDDENVDNSNISSPNTSDAVDDLVEEITSTDTPTQNDNDSGVASSSTDVIAKNDDLLDVEATDTPTQNDNGSDVPLSSTDVIAENDDLVDVDATNILVQGGDDDFDDIFASSSSTDVPKQVVSDSSAASSSAAETEIISDDFDNRNISDFFGNDDRQWLKDLGVKDGYIGHIGEDSGIIAQDSVRSVMKGVLEGFDGLYFEKFTGQQKDDYPKSKLFVELTLQIAGKVKKESLSDIFEIFDDRESRGIKTEEPSISKTTQSVLASDVDIFNAYFYNWTSSMLNSMVDFFKSRSFSQNYEKLQSYWQQVEKLQDDKKKVFVVFIICCFHLFYDNNIYEILFDPKFWKLQDFLKNENQNLKDYIVYPQHFIEEMFHIVYVRRKKDSIAPTIVIPDWDQCLENIRKNVSTKETTKETSLFVTFFEFPWLYNSMFFCYYTPSNHIGGLQTQSINIKQRFLGYQDKRINEKYFKKYMGEVSNWQRKKHVYIYITYLEFASAKTKNDPQLQKISKIEGSVYHDFTGDAHPDVLSDHTSSSDSDENSIYSSDSGDDTSFMTWFKK